MGFIQYIIQFNFLLNGVIKLKKAAFQNNVIFFHQNRCLL